MHRGYIKLWRKSLDNGLLHNPHAFTLWCHILLKASHKPYKQVVGNQIVELDSGQMIVGRKSLAEDLCQNESRIRRGLNLLETMGNVTIKRTSKFSLLTVVKWDTYQNQGGELDQQLSQQATNKRPTDDQQMTTNKNIKNIKNDKKQLHEQLMQQWNDLAKRHGLPQCRTLTAKRTKSLSARIKEGFLDSADEVLKKIGESSFCKGGGSTNWRANFDWLICQADSWVKVLEGKYDDNPFPSSRLPDPDDEYFEEVNRRVINER